MKIEFNKHKNEISIDDLSVSSLEIKQIIDEVANNISAMQKDYSNLVSNYLELLEEQNRIENLKFKIKCAGEFCLRGEIGAIEITVNKKLDEEIGLGFCDVDVSYLDDVENLEIYRIVGLRLFLGPIEHMFYQSLTTLVGGNHQYTDQIKVSFTNASISDFLPNPEIIEICGDKE